MKHEPLIGLGRKVAFDPRDRQYMLEPKKAVEVRSRIWTSVGVFDQGNTAQCVAYSGTKYLTSSPIINKPPMSFEALYTECQRADEWPGEDYDGTSVRALFKVLKRMGLVSEYRWAFSCEPVIDHLLTTGPVVMGTNWTMDMFTPDRWGYIAPTGESAGGHAWLLIGAYRDRKNPDGSRGAVRMINSWGKGWGEQGRAWLTFSSLDALIRDDGEACVATEVKKAA